MHQWLFSIIITTYVFYCTLLIATWLSWWRLPVHVFAVFIPFQLACCPHSIPLVSLHTLHSLYFYHFCLHSIPSAGWYGCLGAWCRVPQRRSHPPASPWASCPHSDKQTTLHTLYWRDTVRKSGLAMNVGCVWVGLKMGETRKRKYALARVDVDDLQMLKEKIVFQPTNK